MIPDGLKVVFVSPCKYGVPGEVKTISYSIAHRLVLSGYCKEFKPDVMQPGTDAEVDKPRGVLVSAICPTFNRRKYIPQAIACFQAQTYENKELVIVDDGSQSCSDLVPIDDARIRYFHLDGKHTTGEKRNICCAKSNGEIIVHWDDDDWSAPTRIADQVERLKDSSVAIVNYFDILYWNDTRKKLFQFHPQSLRCPHGATFAYLKSWWEKHPFEPAQVGEDTNFGRVAMAEKQIAWFPSYKNIVVRAHDHNTCQTADSMGTIHVPEIPAFNLPAGFLPTVPDDPTPAAESWDLFDTLVACRPFDRAGEHLSELYPIAETIARVRPNDLIISDFYKAQWGDAERVLREVAGLSNQFIVTDGDKFSGAIWPGLKGRTAMHHGDHPISDVQRPRDAGINAELITASSQTPAEEVLNSAGMSGLAVACREARLRTWHPRFRQLQLLHIEHNFPILVLASIALHMFAEEHSAKILLMSARDCCLWVDLQKDICERLGGHYEVEYFPSSRVVRNVPSAKYTAELNSRLAKGAVIVDVGGTGKSIARLLEKSPAPLTPGFLITKYGWTNIDGYGPINTDRVLGLTSISDNILEDINCAKHGMYLDWDETAKTTFDWNREEVTVMHDAFNVARLALRGQPLPAYNADVLGRLIHSARPAAGNSLAFIREAVQQEDRIRVRFEKPSGDRDLVISVLRGQPWSWIATYANSLSRSGFKGTKLMFVDSVPEPALTNLNRLGFRVLPFTTKDPARFVTRDRFAPAVAYLKEHAQEYRNVIWTDVRDLIFQSDPSVWLQENMAPARLIGCSESLLVKTDLGYNTNWLNQSFPNDPTAREIVRENEICCGGTVAGEALAMRDLLTKLYEMVCSSATMNDQTALCYLLRVSPFKEIVRVPRNSEGFTATCSWHIGKGHSIHGNDLTDHSPYFDPNGLVYTPDKKKLFCIVHQFDRETHLNTQTHRRYDR